MEKKPFAAKGSVRKNRSAAVCGALAPVLLLTLLLCGCTWGAVTPEPPAAVVTAEPLDPAAPAESAAAEAPVEAVEPVVVEAPVEPVEAEPQRQDGERFDAIILLEGMEEPVKYEHIRNDTLGFEMDYDYELFERQSQPDCERFVSRYDEPGNPENYLEVRFSPRDAEAVAASVSEALSTEYDIIRESYPLDRAGSCIRIDASCGKGNTGTPDQLQMVYIVPAADGCRVATAHYSFESAEGFGRRFSYFMHSFSVLPSQGDKQITSVQALAAIKRYCYLKHPDLDNYVNAGVFPVYWEVISSDEQEIVVLFRSYTGAQLRYYIDPASGDTRVTEYLPGTSTEEAQTDERFNLWEYIG